MQADNQVSKRKKRKRKEKKKKSKENPQAKEKRDSSGTEDYEHKSDILNSKSIASPSVQVIDQDKQVIPQNGNSIFNRFDMPGGFNCHMCGQTFTSQIVLEIHMRTHQRPECQSFCVQCNKSFPNILDLEDHIKSHDDPAQNHSSITTAGSVIDGMQPVEYKSYCMECNKTFRSSLELAEHIMHHDQIANNSNNSVNIPNLTGSASGISDPRMEGNTLPANKNSTNSPTLVTEPKKVGGEKKAKVYTCEVCGKEYKKRSSYKKHLQTHELGIIPIECVSNVDNFQTYSDLEHQKSSGIDLVHVVTPKGIAKVDDSVAATFDCVDGEMSHLSGMTDETSDDFNEQTSSIEQDDSALAMDTKDFHYEGITDKKFECKICFQNFPRQEHLNGHMNKHKNHKYKVQSDGEELSDSPKPFSCSLCDKAFSKQERLAGHMNKHKEYKVKVETLKEAKEKMIKVNCADQQDRWQCPYCEKQLVKRAQLIEHLHDHIGVEPYTCEVCNKGFTKKANYVSHQATHSTELKYECEECNKKFKYSQSLKKHMAKCKKTYSCNQCGGQFSHKRSLNSHVWNVHVRVENCTCKVCGKVMSSCSGLREHELIHSGDRPYKCDICSRGFANRSNLRRHVMIHDNDRPFVCEVCKMTFNRLASLQQHERCHTGEKPYGCSICGLFFTSKSTRRKHERRHTKKKDKKCKFCEKTFWDTYSCRMHERVHTGDLPFECSLCVKKFPERNVLMRHMKLVHKDWYAVNMKDGGPSEDHIGQGDVDLDQLDEESILEPLSNEEDPDEVDYHLSSDHGR
ncbi:uncharacterized protein [Amphiura filiformis]|uniref:uncharacterized protein n=1 Tax=Amphiura filiformis TaxID=82378 RepID=UPI003B228D64